MPDYTDEPLSPVLFCTWGAKGATSYHQGTIGFAQPPVSVKVVDPVGAGDTFIAGVLFALALRSGMDVSKALQLGVIVAGEKVRREGFQGLREAMQEYIGALSA
jgi:ketohexokinase